MGPADLRSTIRARRARRALVAVVLLAGVLAGAVLGRVVAGGPPRPQASRILTARGERLGTAQLDAGPVRPRLVMAMEGESRWSGTWSCELLRADGQWVVVGTWTAADVVNGVWATGLDDPALVDARRLRVLDGRGRVVGEASFGR